MANKLLRRAGLPAAVGAVVAAVAVAGTLLTNGTAGAETAPTAVSHRAVAAAATALAAQHRDVRSAKRAAAPTSETDFGDLTGDGKADLAAVDRAGALWVYPGKAHVHDGPGPRSTELFQPRIKLGAGWGAFTSLVRHGDFNNDGRQDVLARDSQGRLLFYAGTGNPAGMLARATQAGTGWGGFTSIAGGGDLDGDGFDDLLGQKTTGELVLYYGTGNPVAPFRSKGDVIGTGWKGSLLTSVGDWTLDTRTEWVFRNTAGTVYQYDSRSGAFPIGSRYQVMPAPEGFGLQNMVGMGDLTSDRGIFAVPDLLWQLTDGSLMMVAPDTAALDSEVLIGSGWTGYRLF